MRGIIRADIGIVLLLRELNLRAINSKRMPAIKSETIREEGAFKDRYNSCRVVIV
jgi:hypothetical protein